MLIYARQADGDLLKANRFNVPGKGIERVKKNKQTNKQTKKRFKPSDQKSARGE